jgi:hypothetical protein
MRYSAVKIAGASIVYPPSQQALSKNGQIGITLKKAAQKNRLKTY